MTGVLIVAGLFLVVVGLLILFDVRERTEK